MSLLLLFKNSGTTYYQTLAVTAVAIPTISMKMRYRKQLAAIAVGVTTISVRLLLKRTLAVTAVAVVVLNKVTIFASGAVTRFRTMVGLGQ